MGTRDCLLILVALGLASLVVPHSTQAQAWLSDRGRAEGRGIRAGDLELHPGVGLEGGYDSNVFLEDDNTSGQPTTGTATGPNGSVVLYTNEVPDDAVSFRLSPHLFISTLGGERLSDGGEGTHTPPKFMFRAGASGAIYYMVGISNDLTPYGPVRGDGQLNLTETILPERPFTLGFTQEGSLRRVPLQSNPAYQWHGAFGVKTEFGPQGGLLRAMLGYSIGADAYSSYGRMVNLDGYELSDNNSYTHKLTERLNWKFLPKTALFQDFELGLQNYAATGAASPGSDKYNNGRVATRFGANGAFTKELSTTLAVGYGGVFFGDSTRSADDVLAQAIFNWNPSERVAMNVGYGRTIESSLLGNTKRINDINAVLNVNLGGVFLMGLSGSLKFVDYGIDRQQQGIYGRYTGLVAGIGRLGYVADLSRSDIVLDTDLSGEFRLTDWFAMTGQIGYLENFTDYAFLMENGPANEVLVSPAAYRNFSVMLGVRAFL